MIEKILNKLKYNIVTVTLNPVLDRTLRVKNFITGKTHIVDKSESFAGGKGVNVSRALLTFGINSTATGILARGGSDLYLSLLNKSTISHDFLHTDGFLRTNVTIISNNIGKETHLREKGPAINQSVLLEFEEKLKGFAKKNTLIVFSGSLPAGLPQNTYRMLINIIKSAGAEAFLDASGNPLKEGLKAGPLFIKPNSHEVEDALGFFPGSPDDFSKAVRIFHSMDIKNVMISLGKDGIIFSQGREIIHSRLTVTRPINTVGSGDASLAGGLLGIISGLDTADTARLACTTGSANTLISGACVFDTQVVDRFFKKTEITTLDSS